MNKDRVVEDTNCKVYIWEGDVNADPQCLPVSNVKTVSLGGQHRAVLTTDGKLFACGDNSCCQLGIDSSSTFISTLAYVPLGNIHSLCSS
jgi:alpha-tubulin suppressor-like RCC1 family protein